MDHIAWASSHIRVLGRGSLILSSYSQNQHQLNFSLGLLKQETNPRTCATSFPMLACNIQEARPLVHRHHQNRPHPVLSDHSRNWGRMHKHPEMPLRLPQAEALAYILEGCTPDSSLVADKSDLAQLKKLQPIRHRAFPLSSSSSPLTHTSPTPAGIVAVSITPNAKPISGDFVEPVP